MADPNHFDTNPDPGCENIRYRSGLQSFAVVRPAQTSPRQRAKAGRGGGAGPRANHIITTSLLQPINTLALGYYTPYIHLVPVGPPAGTLPCFRGWYQDMFSITGIGTSAHSFCPVAG